MLSPDTSRTAGSAAPLAAIIIGAGFAGIGMAVALQRAGIHDFTIVERSHDVGGVWRDNRYRAPLDVPRTCTRSRSAQSGVVARVRAAARNPCVPAALRAQVRPRALPALRRRSRARPLRRSRRAVARHARRRHDAQRRRARQRHRAVEPPRDARPARHRHVSRPRVPLRARDHDYSLAGKRVAVVGTGASAIQFVPAIAGDVKQLVVFQRSPAYVMPRPDRAYRPWEKALFRRLPWAMKLHRARSTCATNRARSRSRVCTS